MLLIIHLPLLLLLRLHTVDPCCSCPASIRTQSVSLLVVFQAVNVKSSTWLPTIFTAGQSIDGCTCIIKNQKEKARRAKQTEATNKC